MHLEAEIYNFPQLTARLLSCGQNKIQLHTLDGRWLIRAFKPFRIQEIECFFS